MKAGKLVHVIALHRAVVNVNAAGTPATTWTAFATLRAELVERSTEEFLRSAGETDETTVVFRTRYLSGVSNDDRVSFDGQGFNIREVTTIGRRKGLELRCVQVEGTG